MDFITFLQDTNSTILSVLNLVLFIELTIACCRGMYRGWTIGEATAGKIALLTAIATIMFRLWESWPHQWVWFAAWPQCAFWVFVGGLVGCTFRWGVERTFVFAWLRI